MCTQRKIFTLHWLFTSEKRIRLPLKPLVCAMHTYICMYIDIRTACFVAAYLKIYKFLFILAISFGRLDFPRLIFKTHKYSARLRPPMNAHIQHTKSHACAWLSGWTDAYTKVHIHIAVLKIFNINISAAIIDLLIHTFTAKHFKNLF